MSASADTVIPRDILQDVDSQVCGADESEFHGGKQEAGPEVHGRASSSSGKPQFPS